MTKKEFLCELESKLIKIGKSTESKKTIEYFDEVISDMIESGMTENDAVEKLGNIDSIIDSIRDELTTDPIPVEKKKGEYVTDVVAGSVENLIYDDKNNSVIIESSPDDEFHITTHETEQKGYNISQSGNDIKIIAFEKEGFKKIRSIFGFTSVNEKTYPVIIKIPRTFSGNIDSKTTNGSAQIKGVAANNITLKTRNGSVRIESISTTYIDADTTNGSITVNSVASDHTELHTTNGSITLNSIASPTINASTSNGTVHLSSIAGSSLNVSTSNGTVDFRSISVSGTVIFHSSNGKIVGTLAGKMSDYAITSNTSNAKNNLPNGTSGEIKLDVSTSNGRIDVHFSEE